MRRLLILLLAIGAIAGPARAQPQALIGQWQSTFVDANGRFDLVLVITGQSYVFNSVLTNAFGQYATGQTGIVEFYAPDNLRLVVTDWEPKQYLGQPMTRPPNGNYTILTLDQQTLTILDNVCAMQAPEEACITTYRRTL